LVIASILAVLVCLFWFIVKPDFEPLVALITSIIALLSLLFIEKRKGKNNSQNQEISQRSLGIQAGGNVSIRENGEKRKYEKKD
jgi:hypothetical protein